MRREVPVIITFVVGVIMLLSNFIHIPLGDYSLAKLAQEMGTWVIIISAFAVGLASANLIRVHVRNLSGAGKRFNSALLLGALFVWALVGIIQFHSSDSVSWTNP
ncbi:MAG: hypothetical protein ACOX34_04600 [Bacillota bacterium]|jgi:hypothetical protein|nr:hypothetical protein [Candidatus Fermentithermobacillaceae bacterium]